MIPQLVYLALLFIGIGLAWERHGKPKEGDNNAWIDLISQMVIILILYWGGFFDVFFK